MVISHAKKTEDSCQIFRGFLSKIGPVRTPIRYSGGAICMSSWENPFCDAYTPRIDVFSARWSIYPHSTRKRLYGVCTALQRYSTFAHPVQFGSMSVGCWRIATMAQSGRGVPRAWHVIVWLPWYWYAGSVANSSTNAQNGRRETENATLGMFPGVACRDRMLFGAIYVCAILARCTTA